MGEMKKMVWLIGLAIIVVFFLVGCSKKDSAEPVAWDSAFSEAGFTDDEIASYQEVFDTVGVTDFHDISIVDNDPMTVICGKIYGKPPNHLCGACRYSRYESGSLSELAGQAEMEDSRHEKSS